MTCLLLWKSPRDLDGLQAKPSMTKSTVVDNETGKSMDSTVRTSTGTFFARGQDSIIEGVEKRISLVRLLHSMHPQELQAIAQ